MSDTINDTVRYTIEINSTHRDELVALAKQHKLNQGEVMEVLLDHTRGSDKIAELLQAKRESKVSAREALAKLKNMSPVKLAALLAQAEK